MKHWLSILLVTGSVVWLAASMRPPKSPPGFDTLEFARLPVILNGRVQPMDSMARNSLLVLRGRQSVALPGGKSLSAIDWLLEAFFKPELADTRAIFRIDHPDLKAMLKLSVDEKFFSFAQIRPGLGDLAREAERIEESGTKAEQQTPLEKAVIRLQQNIVLHRRIKNSIQPEDSQDFAADLKACIAVAGPGLKAAQDREAGRKDYDEKALEALLAHVQKFDMIKRVAYPLVIPSGTPDAHRDDFANMGSALMESVREGKFPLPVTAYATLASSYRAGDATLFNRTLGEYRQWLAEHHYNPELSKGRSEFYFNHVEPFYKALSLYVLIFVLACFSWFNNSSVLRTAAFHLMILTFLVHTTGLGCRMALEGRPPVTNLYSSAVFIGWGICGLGILIEALHRNAIGSVVSSLGGFTTLIVAHHLSTAGDTMEMMRAVLDTNFWLATHVVAVTLGYSATFLAGFLAMLYVLRGTFSSTLTPEMARSLSRMVYGIVCFATLFSFVGTVLGGIWADQSWGRFWGWDPKENGALMIVLWNAFYLHARWGRVLSERGLMATALFGNIITAFSWFGVNMLGIGLHSYGFMDAAFRWLILFDLVMLAVIVCALLPKRLWRSPLPA
jgi:ABC-type transport system involved in cytochrome c biogenesis permease subunit